MDLKKIRYFAQVARAGSFSRAAQELRIAQPALSRQIRKLEDELGAALLVRHGRGVRLTSAGSTLLEGAEAITDLLRRTSEQVRSGADTVAGQVTLGLPPAAGLLLVAPVARQFRAAWPHVSLHVREGISSMLQEWLLDHRIDVAVIHNPPPLDEVDIELVLNERMVVLAPAESGMSRGDPKAFRFQDLVDLPLIMPSLPHNNRRLVERAAAQHGVRLRIVMEVDSVHLTKQLVKQRLGYTILTYAGAHAEVARGELCAYPIERPPLMSTLAIATLRSARSSRPARELALAVDSVLRGLVKSRRWRGAHSRS